jgi:hypothetical protein
VLYVKDKNIHIKNEATKKLSERNPPGGFSLGCSSLAYENDGIPGSMVSFSDNKADVYVANGGFWFLFRDGKMIHPIEESLEDGYEPDSGTEFCVETYPRDVMVLATPSVFDVKNADKKINSLLKSLLSEDPDEILYNLPSLLANQGWDYVIGEVMFQSKM